MFKKVKLSSIYLLFAALLFAGCEPKDESEEWPAGQNVFAAGIENVKNNSEARLWKNGEIQNLPLIRESLFVLRIQSVRKLVPFLYRVMMCMWPDTM